MGTASIESLDDVPRTPAEPQAQQRFEAETRFGTLGLAWAAAPADASAPGPASRVLRAALQLARAELLVQLLEFRPAAGAAELHFLSGADNADRGSHRAQRKVRDRAKALAQCQGSLALGQLELVEQGGDVFAR